MYFRVILSQLVCTHPFRSVWIFFCLFLLDIPILDAYSRSPGCNIPLSSVILTIYLPRCMYTLQCTEGLITLTSVHRELRMTQVSFGSMSRVNRRMTSHLQRNESRAGLCYINPTRPVSEANIGTILFHDVHLPCSAQQVTQCNKECLWGKGGGEGNCVQEGNETSIVFRKCNM
jgi:hypothetical protein